MSYSTLAEIQKGTTVYVWSRDVRYSRTVLDVDGRYIHVKELGRFGRRTGKGVDEPHMRIKSGAGEILP